MKSKNDYFTGDIFGNLPGRSRKVNAFSGAERVRRRCEKNEKEKVFVSSYENCTSCGGSRLACCGGICNIGQLG